MLTNINWFLNITVNRSIFMLCYKYLIPIEMPPTALGELEESTL